MEENNLDKYFQEKLDGHTEEPTPAVWEGINSKLPKGGFVWNKRYLLLMLLLISIGGAGYLGYRLYEMDSRVAELEEKIKTEKSESISETEKNTNEVSDQSDQITSANNKSLAVESSSSKNQPAEQTPSDSDENSDFLGSRERENSPKMTLAENRSNNSNGSTSETNQLVTADLASTSNPPTGSSNDESASDFEMNLSTPIETVPTVRAQSPSRSERFATDEPSSSGSLTFNPTLLSTIIPSASASPEFTIREREVDYFEEPGSDWYLFAYGMAIYTHRRIIAVAEGSEAVPNQLDKIENGLITPGAGLQLSRELGKSFRISAGVEYNQWIQEGTYSATVPFETVELIANPATQTSEYNFDGTIPSSLGNTSFASTSAENPFNTGFETLSPSSELMFDIQTRRRIDYLSIPINLEYVYHLYPFTLAVGAGISINPVIGSELQYSVADSLPEINFQNEESISGTYLAFQAGVALEYGISERLAIRLNPTYRGWMTPIFENEEIRTLPFGVAIRAGVIYQLGKK